MSRLRGWVVILVAIAAIETAWWLLPAGSPPIYDGNCIADPYETLGGSPAPQPATRVFPASATFPTSEVFTGETPPQAQLLMEPGTFDSSTAVTISITPVAAPAAKPPNGSIEGNVYRYSAVTPAGTELEPRPNVLATIVLRATRSVPAATIDRFDGTRWIPLTTFNSGCGNTFEVTSTKLGAFAAVGASSGGSHRAAPGGGIPVAVIIAGLAVLLIAAIVVLFSLDRGRSRGR